MNDTASNQIQATGEATGFLPARGNQGKPITVIGTAAIRDAFDSRCPEQALNSRGARHEKPNRRSYTDTELG
ncbi:MAG: hypothetical protein ABMA26_16365 [Limisphaerales bacterium]